MKKPHHLAESQYIQKKGDGSYEIFPRGLNIVWGDDQRYWNLDKEGEGKGPATLIQVSWLDVSGVVDVKPGKKYKVTFEGKLKPDAFGWAGSPVLVMAKIGKRGKYEFSEVSLSHTGDGYTKIPPESPSGVILKVPPGPTDEKLYFGLYEVWSGKWKGGLQIKKVNVDCLGGD